MFTISRQFTFCYGHRLLHHAGKCAHPHGHNGTVQILLGGNRLNPQGMIADFNDIKATIGNWIEENLDHRMILEQGDPLVEPLRQLNEPLYLMPTEPTAENLAKLLFGKAKELGLPVCAVQFRETEKCAAEYRADE